nr:hypothetical protein Iba_chr02dCG6280 [Ipomoea batatas]
MSPVSLFSANPNRLRLYSSLQNHTPSVCAYQQSPWLVLLPGDPSGLKGSSSGGGPVVGFVDRGYGGVRFGFLGTALHLSVHLNRIPCSSE